MSEESEFSLKHFGMVCKGSYANILRALENNKGVKVYYQEINDYLPAEKITNNEIDFIFRENNGYTAAEVVEYLQNNGDERFKRSQDLNKFLLAENLLVKEDKVYEPTNKKPNLFIVGNIQR